MNPQAIKNLRAAPVGYTPAADGYRGLKAASVQVVLLPALLQHSSEVNLHETTLDNFTRPESPRAKSEELERGSGRRTRGRCGLTPSFARGGGRNLLASNDDDVEQTIAHIALAIVADHLKPWL